MTNNKFLQLVRTLNTKELKEFNSFVQALYANLTTPLQLFNHIMKFAPKFQHAHLESSYILEHIMPQLKKQKRLSNEAVKLLDWLEGYLIWKQLQEKSHKSKRYLLLMDILQQRQQEDLLVKTRNAFESYEQKELQHLWQDLYQYQSTFKQYYSPNDKTHNNTQIILQQQIEHLDSFYFTNSLKACCELRSRLNILKKSITQQKKSEQVDHKVQLIEQLANATLSTTPLLFQFYLKAYQLISQPNEIYYQAFKKLVNPKSKLAENDLSTGLFYLINYDGRVAREKHDQVILHRCWKLYDLGSNNNWLLEKGFMSEATIHNAINVACGIKKLKWAEDFTKKNISQLKPEEQKLASLVLKARINFEKKVYKQVAEDLKDLKFSNNYHVMNAKLLLVRSYYELRASDDYSALLFKLKNSFTSFLSRNKYFSKTTIKSCQNFMIIFNYLEEEKYNKQYIFKKLESMQMVVCRTWLIEKIKNYSPNQ